MPEFLHWLVVTDVVGSELKNRFGSVFVPEFLCPFDPVVDLLDGGLYVATGDWKALLTKFVVTHLIFVIGQIRQSPGHNPTWTTLAVLLARLAEFGLVFLQSLDDVLHTPLPNPPDPLGVTLPTYARTSASGGRFKHIRESMNEIQDRSERRKMLPPERPVGFGPVSHKGPTIRFLITSGGWRYISRRTVGSLAESAGGFESDSWAAIGGL